jgi:hypothetical protein
VEVHLLLGGAEVDLAVDRRRPGEEAGAEELAEGDRVVIGGHGRDETLVELDALELDAPAAVAAELLIRRRLDRLDVEGGDDARQVRHVRLDEQGLGQDGLREEAAGLVLVGVAARAPEVRGELPGQAVGAAGAERGRRVAGVDAAHLLVGEPAVVGDGAHRRDPGLALGAAGAQVSARSARPWSRSCCL